MSEHRCSKSGYDTALSPDTTKSPPEEGVTYTTHTCSAVVINNWDKRGIREVTLRHRYRNDPGEEQKKTWVKLDFGECSPEPLTVIFYTGTTGLDYWWIEFTDSEGRRWSCKDNFYCYLNAADAGTTVVFSLDGSNEEMNILMNSGGCYVSVHKS